jgi:hypothetical protein
MATLKDWARNEGLDSVGQLEQFRGTAIGIEAEDYLNSILTNTLTREPLLPALGGLPFALQKHVDEDLANYRDAGIIPRFVFNGLQVASKDKAIVSREARKAAKILDDAWSIYDQGRGEEAVNAFGKACKSPHGRAVFRAILMRLMRAAGHYKTDHIARWLQCYLHKSGVRTYTGPYLAAAHMVYCEPIDRTDCSAGSAAVLAFGADKVITSINFENRTVRWVESKVCQGKLMLTPDNFVDLLLLSGNIPALLPPLPEVEAESQRIQATARLLSGARGDIHALVVQQQKDEEYWNAYRKARYFVRHPILVNKDGAVEAKDLPMSAAPRDLHEVVGRRLPDELFDYMSVHRRLALHIKWSSLTLLAAPGVLLAHASSTSSTAH